MKLIILFLFIITQIIIPQRRFVDANNTNLQRDGLSWRTAWNSFAEFNINNTATIPNGTTIKIAPGEYSVGHSSYGSGDLKSLIRIRNNSSLKLILSDPSKDENDDDVSSRLEPAILKGSAEYKRGILIQLDSSHHSISRITIRGLRFENFGLNPVRSRRLQSRI
jgi:hypothetical protein